MACPDFEHQSEVRCCGHVDSQVPNDTTLLSKTLCNVNLTRVRPQFTKFYDTLVKKNG